MSEFGLFSSQSDSVLRTGTEPVKLISGVYTESQTHVCNPRFS